jgi:hypothetical protein
MLPGQREFEAHVRYFDQGSIRRYESPLWSHNYLGAVVTAEKLVLSAHPTAEIMSIHIIDVERKKKTVPRLVFTNPNDPPKSRA